MSQQAVAEFFSKINTDAALQQELEAALQGKEDMAAATAFAQVGAKHGYEFTAMEAAQKHQEIVAAAEGELNEEALDNVAGGTLFGPLLGVFSGSSNTKGGGIRPTKGP